MKDEGFEFLMAVLPPGPNKNPVLKEFLTSLSFIRDKKEEFRTVELQRFLRCGYGTVCKVIDALLALCVIETIEERPRKYRCLTEINSFARRRDGVV